MEQWKMGNLYDGTFNDDIKTYFSKVHVYSKEGCRNCWAKFFCSGGCNANSFQYEGDVKKPYKLACEMQKKRLECAIALAADRAVKGHEAPTMSEAPVVAENVGEVNKELPEPVFSGKYMNMHYMDSANMENVELDNFTQYDTHDRFHNGWFYKSTEGGSMKFTVNCSVLEMVFKANNSEKYGTADIYVDGVKTSSVSSNMSDGWNNPVTAYLIDDDSSAEHTVEIRMEPDDGSAYFVLAFGYCD